MAGKGGLRSTSFKKGQGKQKGVKHASTKVKEAIGLTGWEKLCEYIKTEGAEKMVEEMSKLKGRDYWSAYAALSEFIKPKLARTTLSGDPENPLIPAAPLNDSQVEALIKRTISEIKKKK